jgi:MFS family permease
MICSSENRDFLISVSNVDGLSIQMRDQTGLTARCLTTKRFDGDSTSTFRYAEWFRDCRVVGAGSPQSCLGAGNWKFTMNAADGLSPDQENRVAKRNAFVYAICQALNGAASPINIALGGLAGSYLLGADKSLATAPVTGFSVGMALGAIPAAMLTRHLGRKYGFMIGLLIGIGGMLVATYALMIGSFLLFCAGATANGIASGFGQQYRFAAADRGTADFKAKAISWVLVGGVASAVIGAQLIIYTGDLLLPVQYAGAYLCASLLFVLAIAAMSFLDGSSPHQSHESGPVQAARPLFRIMAQPRFLVALLCGTSSFALMSLVMTGAPLAMVAEGISRDHAVVGIQWHVMAMFAPSFFTGHLIARFGKETIVATGLVILIACGAVALMGINIWHFWVSLILLGIGWNFGFIGSTAMITDTYAPHEKNKAQGAHDFILFSMVAVASFMSGLILNAFGWATLNMIIFPVVVISILSLIWLLNLERKRLPGQASAQ